MNSNKLSFWGTKFFETLTQPKFFASAPAVKEIYRALKSLMVFALWKTRTLVEQLKIHAQIVSTWFFSLAMLMTMKTCSFISSFIFLRQKNGHLDKNFWISWGQLTYSLNCTLEEVWKTFFSNAYKLRMMITLFCIESVHKVWSIMMNGIYLYTTCVFSKPPFIDFGFKKNTHVTKSQIVVLS